MKSRRFYVLFLAVCLVLLASLSGRAPRGALPPEDARELPKAPGPEESGGGLSATILAPNQTSGVQQVGVIRFARISLEEGLSQSGVLAILQDHRGLMWFGTEDGLNEYDGYQFTVYKHDPSDPLSLSDNGVYALYQDHNGDVWVGTRRGLDRLDRASGTFAHYQYDPRDPQSLADGARVSAIHVDRTGALWVGVLGGGLNKLDRFTGSFTHYRHDSTDPTTLADDAVHAIYEDREGVLWVGTGGGLDRFDQASGTFGHYQHDADDPASLSHDRVRVIFEDSQGGLWVGTDGGGLDRLDRASGTFTHYRHSPHDPHSLSDNQVQAILEDSAGELWVGTQRGLNLLDRRRNYFVRFLHDPDDPYSLSNDSILTLYQDRGGVLWIGTFGGGLSKVSPSASKFGLYQHRPNVANSLNDDLVWAICEDRRGNLWIGTFQGGLNRLDRQLNSFRFYRHNPSDPTSLSSNDVRAVLEDRGGVLWIGTAAGLDRFDPATERLVHYWHDPGDPNSLSENRVRALAEDRLGRLWVGTESGGLNRLNRGVGTFVRYQHDPDDPFSLGDDQVRAIYEDREGNLWVGTLGGGVSVLDTSTDRFTRYQHDPDDPDSLSNDAVLGFYQDSNGAMWMATYGGGLNRFDLDTQTFTRYTGRDGLSNDGVYGVLADAEGFLWVSTNRGLSRFDPATETFRNYDVSDGLQSNEFNLGAYFQSDSGEMFFGGIKGFNAFYPQQVTDNPYVPPVVVTALSKFNQVVRTDLSPDERIQLSYQDNFISFEFAALDYTAPQKNQYAYMMEGLDRDWVYAGTRRHVDYPNLEAGDYVFRVRGTNNDGIWNQVGVAVYVTVTPPFWQTWWFRALALLALVGSLTGVYRLRVRSIEARNLELESQVAERTREIRQRTGELEALYRAYEEMHRYLRLDEVLQVLVDIAVDILQADKSSLMVWDERGENLVVRVAHGFKPETMAQMVFPPGEGTVGLVASTGQPAIVEDVQADARVARRITEPEGIRSFMHVPIEVGGQIFGVFNVDYLRPRAFGDDERRLFVALAQRAALAIENAQLYEQAQQAAVLEERQRLARDLHDAVTQTLFSASLIAEVLPSMWESDQEESQQLLRELQQLSRGALAEMRTLLLELRPNALAEMGLGDLLHQLAEATIGRLGIPVEVVVTGQCDLPVAVHTAVYRIAQEALNNVIKHAGASRVTVSLSCEPGSAGEMVADLGIRDDGCGFDPDCVPPGHLGLSIMRERAEAVGAGLEVESQAGQGTRIRVTWPGDA